MHTRVAIAIALVVCLVLSPIGFAAGKDKAPAAKQTVKKVEAKKDAKAPATSWKTGAAPVVRTIPYQPLASTQPARFATSRPAGSYVFQTPIKYDYFADHYGRSTGTNIVGYVPPEKSKTSPATGANAGNPFIYRRGQ